MGFIIGLLTLVLVLDCVVLVLLVLVQLPKKEAGAGLAFGGAASDALFGAGSGTVLTKITKYAAGIFFVLAVFLGLLQAKHRTRGATDFERDLLNPSRPPTTATTPAPAATPAAPPATPAASGQVAGTNLLMSTPIAEEPKVPAAPAPSATNAAPPK